MKVKISYANTTQAHRLLVHIPGDTRGQIIQTRSRFLSAEQSSTKPLPDCMGGEDCAN